MISRAVVVALVVASFGVAPAFAAPPSGTLSCSVWSAPASGRPTGMLFMPGISENPQLVKFNGTNDGGSSCDNSRVTGGKAPIETVTFKFTARMSAGTCAALTSSTPPFEKARLKLTWRGVNAAGRSVKVGSSNTRVASASYDAESHTLTLTTQPLTGNAFRGRTVTLSLGFHMGGPNGGDFMSFLESGCPGGGGFVAMTFGEGNAATLVVE